jgi:hypothetical protein
VEAADVLLNMTSMFAVSSLMRLDLPSRVRRHRQVLNSLVRSADPTPWTPSEAGVTPGPERGLSMKVTQRLVPAFVAGAIALSGCGDKAKTTAMPTVVGKRLDVAKSDLKVAGVENEKVEVVGGGTFGVLSESNWRVCDQQPGPNAKNPDHARLIIARVCGVGDAAGVPTTTNSLTPPSTAAASSAVTVIVPNVVGMDLQQAQDLMQTRGFYSLTSHDATGQRRLQVLDRNWKVCDQQPTAGMQASTYTKVDMGAVKDEESCP